MILPGNNTNALSLTNDKYLIHKKEMSFSTTPMNINFLVSCSTETFSQSLILFEISQKSMNGPESVILGHLPFVFSLFVKNSQ